MLTWTQPKLPPEFGSQAQLQPTVHPGAAVVVVVVLQSQVVVVVVVVGPEVVVVVVVVQDGLGSIVPVAQKV